MTSTIAQLRADAEARKLDAERRLSDSKAASKRLLDSVKLRGESRLNAEEDSEYEKLTKTGREAQDELKRVEGELKTIAEVEADEKRIDADSADRKPTGATKTGGEQTYNAGNGSMLYGAGGPEAAQFTRQDGRNAVIERTERVADSEYGREMIARTAERDKHIVGQHGDFAGLVRSISTTSGAAAIVPTIWAANVIDKARNAAVMFQAGAQLVPMDAKVIQVGRITTDPAPVFRVEGAAIPATDPALDFIQFTATSLGTVVVASVEVLQDAPNAGEIVQNVLAKAMALEIDKAAMFGQLGATGTNDEGAAFGLASPYPMGILKNLNTNFAAGVIGAFPTNGTTQTAATPWLEMLSLVYSPLRNNERCGAIVSNVALQQQYQNTYDTLNEPIRMPSVLQSIPWLTTNAIPSYTRGTMVSRATDVFAGDFSQVLIGQRLGLEIRVLTERYAELGQVGLLAFWRGDVQVARPKAMACYRALQGAL